ncbi:hypothetical protein OIU85_018116 [Salix viminalis]|uniref:Uncharacterized protein n=1 Tax=Salix viminalis TaxID=40686 RepID=A0A9Q0UTL5_SALVM|nr:hypothetical protein OIU85_018116 [Salix viminalis]
MPQLRRVLVILRLHNKRKEAVAATAKQCQQTVRIRAARRRTVTSSRRLRCMILTATDSFLPRELQSMLSRLGLWDEMTGKDCRGLRRFWVCDGRGGQPLRPHRPAADLVDHLSNACSIPLISG